MTNNITAATNNNTITLDEVRKTIAMASDSGIAPEANSLKEVLKEAETILAFSSNISIWPYLEKVGKMKEVHLLNSFSISMLPSQGAIVGFIPMSSSEVIEVMKDRLVISHIGHGSTTSLVGQDLKVNLYTCRDNFSLGRSSKDITTIVAQYVGPRLPEGATELPEEAQLKYFMVCPAP